MKIHHSSVWLCCLLLLNACAFDQEYQQPDITLPTLSINDITKEEGNTTTVFEFTVSLEGNNFSRVGVSFETVNGTALAGEDYLAIPKGYLLFSPGEKQKTIAVTIITNRLRESDENFEIRLSNPVNAVLTKSTGLGTILNDDVLDVDVFIPDGYTTPTSYPGRTLVWSDEFSGDSLNMDYWTHEIGTGNNGWGNNELQYYRAENTFMYDGHLVIEARKEPFGNQEYTSSRIVTRGKKDFKFGRIDIRALLPEGQGLWPALWMLGRNITQIGWPACGEIDIMEIIGSQPGRVHGTVHFGNSTAQHQFIGGSKSLPGGAKFSEEFHVFSIIWEQNSIKWLLDDEQFFQYTPAQGGSAPYPFNNNFFFIFNVAVGGNWPGSPDASTVFPQRMVVDYIRVFQ